jgi:solute carrier family 25 citrate transporter 1
VLKFPFRQRESPFQVIRHTIRTQGVKGLYAGCSALVVGNGVKAGVRFLSYDTFKSMLADKEVSIQFVPGEQSR